MSVTHHWRRLSICYGHFDLPQQIHDLLRLVLLASSHMLSLSSVSLIHWHISSRALRHHAEFKAVYKDVAVPRL